VSVLEFQQLLRHPDLLWLAEVVFLLPFYLSTGPLHKVSSMLGDLAQRSLGRHVVKQELPDELLVFKGLDQELAGLHDHPWDGNQVEKGAIVHLFKVSTCNKQTSCVPNLLDFQDGLNLRWVDSVAGQEESLKLFVELTQLVFFKQSLNLIGTSRLWAFNLEEVVVLVRELLVVVSVVVGILREPVLLGGSKVFS